MIPNQRIGSFVLKEGFVSAGEASSPSSSLAGARGSIGDWDGDEAVLLGVMSSLFSSLLGEASDSEVESSASGAGDVGAGTDAVEAIEICGIVEAVVEVGSGSMCTLREACIRSS